MKDPDKTKEQLIAELEAMREQIHGFEQKERRRGSALRLLSKVSRGLDDQGFPRGMWDWYPRKDHVIIYRQIEERGKTVTLITRYKSDIIFEGKWEEIVHADDLNALMEDLNSVLAGKDKYPVFCFRTKHTANVPERVMAISYSRESDFIIGTYMDPTGFMELIENLTKEPELSKDFVEGQLKNCFPPRDPNELVVAVMWDILVNEILEDYPHVTELINNTVLPYYEKIASYLTRCGLLLETRSIQLEFLVAAIWHFHGAVFQDWGYSDCLVSPTLARLLGLPESKGYYSKHDLPWLEEANSEGFEEMFFDDFMGSTWTPRKRPIMSKLIKINTGKTTTELMIIQMTEEYDPPGHIGRWGIVCNPREIEQNAELGGRLIEYESKAMRDALEKAGKVAKLDTTVLITGESGSGKEYVAKYIHKHSNRIPEDYFAIDCASIPPELAESELFGYEEGGHSQAKAMKPGLLEQANDGTILLDEIGDLPLSLQPKLLRFFDTKKFVRVGGTRKSEVTVNARIIAATNTDLEQAVQSGTFRRDLFYRINEFRIEVPPLRDRPEDIPILVREFLNQIQREMRPPRDLKVDPGELQKLIGHDWLGNVRQLHDVLTSSSILAEGSQLRIDLPKSGAKQETGSALGWKWNVGFPPDKKLEDLAKDMKRALIDEALRQAAGKKTEAARLLGISRDSLNKQMKTLGISSVRKTHSPE